ncbi:MAG TPA: choice-of-anchor J domain-containing protein [Chiayiivirga sp.]|nr:choice-of-anchor J domain-containing protein [Chiayiivirga sp.]
MNRGLVCGIAALLILQAACAEAVTCSEGFGQVSQLQHRGWLMRNNSDPIGTTSWFQGNPNVFPAYSGSANSFVSADADSASSSGYPVLSNWLITPVLEFGTGEVFQFVTRASPGGVNRLVVRVCIMGGGVDCAAPGPQSGSLGDFQGELLDINSGQSAAGYPSSWTVYQISSANGLPSSGLGRIAFHYYAFWQPNMALGTTIGIDEVSITGSGGCLLTGVVYADGFE